MINQLTKDLGISLSNDDLEFVFPLEDEKNLETLFMIQQEVE